MKELVKGVHLKRMPDGRAVARVHFSAHPERGPEWVREERRKYSSQGTWDREQEIIHEAGGGERLFADVLSRHAERILIDPYARSEQRFQPSPHWKRIGGFDVGKANPTAALVACVDWDGVIYILAEYYQPGLTPAQNAPHLKTLNGFSSAEVFADPSIFYQTQAQSDGSFKAVSQLYAEQGIANLAPAPENNELLGMERILAHWQGMDDGREPTLKIVCSRDLREIQKPVYGTHNDGCSNLLWELRRTRREELSSTQLIHRNPTERIVDKDNHLRDCLKYLVLALPEPCRKTSAQTAQEKHEHLLLAGDMTSYAIRYQQTTTELERNERPPALGRRGIRNRRGRR